MKNFLLLPALILLSINFSWAKTNLTIITQTPGFTVSGSALCENLNLTYNLPDSLKTQYNIDVRFVANEKSNTAEILYIATKTNTDHYIGKIVTDITSYFLPIDMGDSTNKWTFNFNVQIDNKISNTSSQLFTPYGICSEFSYDCDSMVYTKKELIRATDCGSSNETVLGYYYLNDSLIITKTEGPVLTVCVPYETHIRENTLAITDFEAKTYNVYEFPLFLSNNDFDSTQTIITFAANDTVIDGIMGGELIFITLINISYGEADMTSCIINSTNDLLETQYAIYPNPATNNIYINGFSGELKLTNQLGQSYILAQNYSVEHLPAGMYIATYEIDGNLIQSHLIIE